MARSWRKICAWKPTLPSSAAVQAARLGKSVVLAEPGRHLGGMTSGRTLWSLVRITLAGVIAYLLMIGAGLRVASRTDRAFEKLLAVGLTTIIGMQAFIIVGGVIRLVPLTGITLPFVSYGGSSLLANYVLLALLIRISDTSARRLGEIEDLPTIGERWQARRLRRKLKKATSGSVDPTVVLS